MSPRFSDGKLDIRYLFLGDANEAAFTALLPNLDNKERTQAKRFLLMRDRLAFAAGRALVRRMLSDHSVSPVEGWRLEQDSYGKPALAHALGAPDLRFNISHCQGVVVAAVSLGRDVGVDVEFTGVRVDHLELARAHFAVDEVNLIGSLTGPEQRDAFFAIWTLKEAYLKAQGKGLSIPLSGFAFTLQPLTISFSSQSRERPEDWFLWQDHLSPSHLFAIAARRFPEEELTCCMSAVPLAELIEQTF